MAGTIGSLTFAVMEGVLHAPAPHVEALERVGENGAELRDEGIRDTIAELVTLAGFTDQSAAAAAAAAHRALVGTLADVIDAQGATHANCLIMDARPIVRPTLLSTTGATHTRLVETRWTVRRRYVETLPA